MFKEQDKSWRLAFKAIGITGIVVAVFTRALIREPRNRRKIILAAGQGESSFDTGIVECSAEGVCQVKLVDGTGGTRWLKCGRRHDTSWRSSRFG